MAEERHHSRAEPAAHPGSESEARADYQRLLQKDERGQLTHRESHGPHERELYLAVLEGYVRVHHEAQSAEHQHGCEGDEQQRAPSGFYHRIYLAIRRCLNAVMNIAAWEGLAIFEHGYQLGAVFG